jgi:hypothetical protein
LRPVLRLPDIEVDFAELRQGRKVLLQHIAAQLVLLAIGAVALRFLLGLDARPALLFALALFTPSTGFILDSLHGFGLIAAAPPGGPASGGAIADAAARRPGEPEKA